MVEKKGSGPMTSGAINFSQSWPETVCTQNSELRASLIRRI